MQCTKLLEQYSRTDSFVAQSKVGCRNVKLKKGRVSGGRESLQSIDFSKAELPETRPALTLFWLTPLLPFAWRKVNKA